MTINAAYCQQAMDNVGSGVAASLRGVDCAAGSLAQTAFGRLFGTDGALVPALVILLTLYVAFFGFALMTGRSRLGMVDLIPRMITIGLVLTFATSWLAYQSLVWNVAIGGPDQLAALLTGVKGSATQVFADKIDIVFAALVESSGSAARCCCSARSGSSRPARSRWRSCSGSARCSWSWRCSTRRAVCSPAGSRGWCCWRWRRCSR